jgi:hypothetical protein
MCCAELYAARTLVHVQPFGMSTVHMLKYIEDLYHDPRRSICIRFLGLHEHEFLCISQRATSQGATSVLVLRRM